ncbi:hypothetical protein VKT23_013977 [Stygiomarasmius scandens]|uniref:EF-hand domain-containing protein n=1 Tax=Marasmiellus scandens TaxID=2682957 RepID=A0ABR1J455_9AGAR
MNFEDASKRTSEQLNKAGNIISLEAHSQSREQGAQRVRKILQHLKEASRYTLEVPELPSHQQAEECVLIFTTLLDREIERTKNIEEIVVIYQLFATAIFCATYIGFDLDEALAEHLEELRNHLKRFGSFAKKYHRKFKPAVVRFLKAEDFKHELLDLTRAVGAIIQDLQQNYATMEANNITGEVQIIVNRLGTSSTKGQKQAQKFVNEARGGIDEIVYNNNKIKELASLLDDPVTNNTITMLQEWDLDSFLQEDMEDFSENFDDLRKDVQSSHSLIINKLSAGPHHLIENEEFKKVWEDHKWKTSVKGKLFVDEMCGYFREQFNKPDNMDQHKDKWTLPILTHIMFHPTVVDAIDDDGSGYISVQEFNTFLKQKPEEWSPPEWFAFWAMGWQQLMLLASIQVADLAESVKKTAAAKRQSTDEYERAFLDYYLQDLLLIGELVTWHEISGYNQYFMTDLRQHDAEMTEMERLILDYQSTSEKMFNKLMAEERGFELTDPSDIKGLQSKFDNRVEVWIIPFLIVVLEQHLKKINGEDGYGPITDDQWYKMDITLSVLIYELYNRMQSLERRWRVQKLNLGLQATSFSGGILASWYNAVHSDKKDYREALELIISFFEDEGEQEDSSSVNDEEATQENPQENDQGQAQVSSEGTSVATELQSLRASVSDLQRSVAELTRIIQSMQSSMARGTGINETNRIQQQNSNVLNEEEDGNTAQVDWTGGQDPDENDDDQGQDEDDRQQEYDDY